MGITIISEDGCFEWDMDKNKRNKKDHGLFLSEILPAFDDPFLLEYYDETHSTHNETRFKSLAELQDSIILFLSYTEQSNGRTRIISARLAEPIEEKNYHEWRKSFVT